MQKILIIIGSESNRDLSDIVERTLLNFDIGDFSTHVISAHRNPEKLAKTIKNADSTNTQVYIAIAGLAAHLAGAIAARTIKPVIGVPAGDGPLSGFDSLLSTVQMPGGVPVATVAIGKAGATNAAYLALQILSLNDTELANKLLLSKLRPNSIANC